MHWLDENGQNCKRALDPEKGRVVCLFPCVPPQKKSRSAASFTRFLEQKAGTMLLQYRLNTWTLKPVKFQACQDFGGFFLNSACIECRQYLYIWENLLSDIQLWPDGRGRNAEKVNCGPRGGMRWNSTPRFSNSGSRKPPPRGIGEGCSFSTERENKVGLSEAPKSSHFPRCPVRGFQPSGSYPRATDNPCNSLSFVCVGVSRVLIICLSLFMMPCQYIFVCVCWSVPRHIHAWLATCLIAGSVVFSIGEGEHIHLPVLCLCCVSKPPVVLLAFVHVIVYVCMCTLECICACEDDRILVATLQASAPHARQRCSRYWFCKRRCNAPCLTKSVQCLPALSLEGETLNNLQYDLFAYSCYLLRVCLGAQTRLPIVSPKASIASKEL